MKTWLILQRPSDGGRYEEPLTIEIATWVKMAHAVEQGGKAWWEGRPTQLAPTPEDMGG